jgi:hypothetical protein
MKGLCKLALAALLVAACGGDGAITEPHSRDQLGSPGGGILAIGVDPTTGATIETNKDDYAPGEIVHVAGHGWAPGEKVNLHMTENPDTHADVDTNVVADDTGAFSVHYYDVQTHDIEVTFTLTATGATSGSRAVAVFTDDVPTVNSFTVDGTTFTFPASPPSAPATNPITVAPGAVLTVLVNATTVTGSPGLANWMSTEVAVKSAALSIDFGDTDFCDDFDVHTGNSAVVGLTRTVSYTMPTTPGTYDIRVRADNGDNCNGGGSKIYNGAVIVSAPSAVGTTTTLSATPVSPTVFGQSVTFTAAVTPNTGSSTPTGVVKFYEFSGVIDCSTASGALSTVNSAPFEYTTTALSAGSHRIWACYEADAGWTDSNDDISHQVNQANVDVVVSAAPASPTNVGDPVTFTATVTATSPGSGTPTGTVTFFDGACGTTQIGSTQTLPANQVTTSALAAGSHTITACYSGDGNFNSNSGSTSHSVSLLATVTELISSANPSVTGQPVTFTATVKHNGSAIGANGTVEFRRAGTGCSNGIVFATVSLDASGQATTPSQSYNAVDLGFTIVACYSGTATYASSFKVINHFVEKANTSATATDSDDPSVFGQSITLGTTVTAVSPGTGTPTGNVKFWKLTSGDCDAPVGTQLGVTQTLSAGGTASVSYAEFSVGSHTITVCYAGDDNYKKTSQATTHQVNKAQTTLALSTNTATTFGSQATFTANITVNSPGGGTPSGTVLFKDGGTCNADGTITGGTTLGAGSSVTISSGQAVFNTNNLAAGSHTIVACYGGDGSFFGDGDSQTHVVNALGTTVTLSVSPATQQYSDKSVFKATITPVEAGTSPVTPLEGTVYFYVETAVKTCGMAVPPGDVGTVAIVDDDNGVDSITFTMPASLLPSATSYAVTACFYPTTANFTRSADNKTLKVNKEDAAVSDEAIAPSNILVGSGGILTFKVRETNGSIATELNAAAEKTAGLVAAGNISLISDTDVDVTAKGVLDPSKTIAFSCTRTVGAGTEYAVILSFSCTFGPVNVADTYEVDIDIDDANYDGSGAAVLQITDPNAGFTTGGGWYWYDQQNYPGEKVNFGFMAKTTTNNKKTVFQGSLLVIRHLTDGSIIKIKSNVFEGYSVGTTSNNCTPATFSGKATYSVNGVSDGNYAFTGYGMDCGEPGTADKFSLYHAKSPNAVSTAGSVGELSTKAKTLAGGNVQVPQPSRR